MTSGGGPGWLQRWLLFKVPEVLLGVAAVAFLIVGVYLLIENPSGLFTQADQPSGPDAPMQAWNVVYAIVAFAVAAGLAFKLGWALWRRSAGSA